MFRAAENISYVEVKTMALHTLSIDQDLYGLWTSLHNKTTNVSA